MARIDIENIERRIGLLKIKGCDNPDRTGDVIFVHGLSGHPITTWYPQPEEIEKEVDTQEFWQNKLENLNFWLNWLAEDTNNLGIWSYGYEAARFAEEGHASPIFDQAGDLLTRLEITDLIKPRIFITHSLGGLIVKSALLSANNYKNAIEIRKEILDSTRGVVFLATPHQGSNLANFPTIISKIVKVFRTPTIVVNEMQKDQYNTQLVQLNDFYIQNHRFLNIKTDIYYEMQRISIPLEDDVIVVDRDSATLGGIEGVSPRGVTHANHITIAKPQNKSDIVYQGVLNFIEEYLNP